MGVVHGRAARRGARARGAGDHTDLAAVAHLLDAAAHEVAGAHVARLFLGPDHFRLRVAPELGGDLLLGPRVELLEPDDGDRRVDLVAPGQQLVAELAAAEHEARHRRRGLGPRRVGEHELERARLQRGGGRVRRGHAQVALRCHHDHRLALRGRASGGAARGSTARRWWGTRRACCLRRTARGSVRAGPTSAPGPGLRSRGGGAARARSAGPTCLRRRR